MAKLEFTVANAYQYNRNGVIPWLASHFARSWRLLLLLLTTTILSNLLSAAVPSLTGAAFNVVFDQSNGRDQLLALCLGLLAAVAARGVTDITGRFSSEFLSSRLMRDAREELYLSLLGKSQTFHNRQRVGDLMARASGDTEMLGSMVNPGMDVIVDSFINLAITLIFIAVLNVQLLLVPVLFTLAFFLSLRGYTRRLQPVSSAQRSQNGVVNSVLAETVTGIEVVKATAQEAQEQGKFDGAARKFRDLFVRSGEIQARYLPTLLLAMAIALAFLHGVYLLDQGQINIGNLVAFMGLVGLMRYPAGLSNWTFNLVQSGLAASNRILSLLKEETELDQNPRGYSGKMRGEITFEHVTFSYDGQQVLTDVSFTARPGQTVAIVGQTGSGKSTLTKLVNRIYDVDAGRVLVDGVDVREWNLDSLRSQISTIEQDVFLFSRSIAQNIGFSMGQQIDLPAIEEAAQGAQAHAFISSFKNGYDTMIGERGVTLSGGQRQRLAIARALLTEPSILMLDDSTSAIDSATEDEIQKAIRRLLENRTTLLITHRLSQIRWADKILVLKQGSIIDQGTHQELLERCDLYRRIFLRNA